MHVEKFTRGALGHMLKHFGRELGTDGQPINYSNQAIDLSRSHLNYNLAPSRQSQYGFVKKRCAEVYCLNRRDVNVMCSCVVTLPKGVREGDEQQFFSVMYDFLSDRYGVQNVVSAFVHMDETTPHMHFAFVPVAYDKKRQRDTVSAKLLINRQDLKTLHPDAEKAVRSALGYDVGIMTGELSNRPDLTLEQYKSLKEYERLAERMESRIKELNAAGRSVFEQYKKTLAALEQTRTELDDHLTRLDALKRELFTIEGHYMGPIFKDDEITL